MRHTIFLGQVKVLREQGLSIRVIAAELSVHKGRVERALKLVAPRQDPDKLGPRTDPTNRIFVGRQQELAVLKAALEESLTGRGRLAMLMGEPGIGKTSTAQELASYAETLGTQVLWGRCYEEEGAPPCGISRISTARPTPAAGPKPPPSPLTTDWCPLPSLWVIPATNSQPQPSDPSLERSKVTYASPTGWVLLPIAPSCRWRRLGEVRGFAGRCWPRPKAPGGLLTHRYLPVARIWHDLSHTIN